MTTSKELFCLVSIDRDNRLPYVVIDYCDSINAWQSVFDQNNQLQGFYNQL